MREYTAAIVNHSAHRTAPTRVPLRRSNFAQQQQCVAGRLAMVASMGPKAASHITTGVLAGWCWAYSLCSWLCVFAAAALLTVHRVHRQSPGSVEIVSLAAPLHEKQLKVPSPQGERPCGPPP